jgi:hypothetical protein
MDNCRCAMHGTKSSGPTLIITVLSASLRQIVLQSTNLIGLFFVLELHINK